MHYVRQLFSVIFWTPGSRNLTCPTISCVRYRCSLSLCFPRMSFSPFHLSYHNYHDVDHLSSPFFSSSEVRLLQVSQSEVSSLLIAPNNLVRFVVLWIMKHLPLFSSAPSGAGQQSDQIGDISLHKMGALCSKMGADQSPVPKKKN